MGGSRPPRVFRESLSQPTSVVPEAEKRLLNILFLAGLLLQHFLASSLLV